LATRITFAPTPKPPSLTETLRIANLTNWSCLTHPRPRASACIVEGGTQLGHIVAWRLWRWDRGHLRGIGVREVWPEREAREAECLSEGKPRHRPKTLVPVWGCHCGFYALRAEPFTRFLWDVMHADSSGARLILGTVALWGRIVTHQDGYRAQYACPLQCFAEMRGGVFKPLAWLTADALKRRYGVMIGSPEEAALLLSPPAPVGFAR